MESYLSIFRVDPGVSYFVSPVGISIVACEPENSSESDRYVEERKLVVEWAALDQPVQKGPDYEWNHYTTCYARAVVKNKIPLASSFMIKVPYFARPAPGQGDNGGEPRNIAGYLRCFLFSWSDIESRELPFDSLFLPNLDWNIISHPSPHLPVLPIHPERPIIHETMSDHKEVYTALTHFHPSKNNKVLILNLDAHHDFGYGNENLSTLSCGNWAGWAERDGFARVVHLPSYFRNANYALPPAERQENNWNTESRRRSILEEVQLILQGEDISEIWLTIDDDSFSLRAPANKYEGNYAKEAWTGRPYHMQPAEIEKELLALKEFLTVNGIQLHRILPCSSPEYLGIPTKESSEYIRTIDKLIQQVFI
ncbi:MAG: hypothetical protein WCV91_01630 [Candidatus Margulisiibacteriota bacterium]